MTVIWRRENSQRQGGIQCPLVFETLIANLMPAYDQLQSVTGEESTSLFRPEKVRAATAVIWLELRQASICGVTPK